MQLPDASLPEKVEIFQLIKRPSWQETEFANRLHLLLPTVANPDISSDFPQSGSDKNKM